MAQWVLYSNLTVAVFLAIAFLTAYNVERPLFCMMACMPVEISCLATVSYTFGLVPATALSASSALSGCAASFEICEISCAKRSNVTTITSSATISNTCQITRNGTNIPPIYIKTHKWLANPFNLDAECHPRHPKVDIPSATSTTEKGKLKYPAGSSNVSSDSPLWKRSCGSRVKVPIFAGTERKPLIRIVIVFIYWSWWKAHFKVLWKFIGMLFF